MFRWCYHARCTGAQALQRLEGHAVAAAVRAAREAAPVPPFDVMAAAHAPRCRMSTDHAYPPSKCVAETYNVYFWRHHRLNLHADLPLPFVRAVDASDGKERSCRLCKPNTNGARRRDPLLICCDSCPGVFHRECVGLDAVPQGAWECAACVRGMWVRCACGRPRSPTRARQGREEHAAAAPRTSQRRGPRNWRRHVRAGVTLYIRHCARTQRQRKSPAARHTLGAAAARYLTPRAPPRVARRACIVL